MSFWAKTDAHEVLNMNKIKTKRFTLLSVTLLYDNDIY